MSSIVTSIPDSTIGDRAKDSHEMPEIAAHWFRDFHSFVINAEQPT